MSDTGKNKEQAAPVEKEQPVRKCALSAFRPYSRKLFGVSVSTFDAATAKMEPDKDYSNEEVKAVIEAWLKKPYMSKKGKEGK